MSDFRVKFKLTGESAKAFNAVKDKPEFVAKAIEWYYGFGGEIVKKLDRIEAALLNGVIIQGGTKTEDVKTESIDRDLDNCFDDFVV